MNPSLSFAYDQAHLRLGDFAVALTPLATGYQLNITAQAEHTGLQRGWPVLITGELRLDGGARPSLGFLQTGTNGPWVLRDFETPLNWAVPLTYEALDAIERHRNGQDFALALAAHALVLPTGPDTMEWPEAAAYITIAVPSGEWIRQLEQVNAAASVCVVVHPPAQAPTGRRAEAAGYVRTAQRLLADGLYPQAVAEARKVLDVLDEIAPGPTSEELTDAKPRTRDKLQRWSAMRVAVQQLANAAPHADRVTAEITWGRFDAITVIAAIAGLLARVEDLTEVPSSV